MSRYQSGDRMAMDLYYSDRDSASSRFDGDRPTIRFADEGDLRRLRSDRSALVDSRQREDISLDIASLVRDLIRPLATRVDSLEGKLQLSCEEIVRCYGEIDSLKERIAWLEDPAEQQDGDAEQPDGDASDSASLDASVEGATDHGDGWSEASYAWSEDAPSYIA